METNATIKSLEDIMDEAEEFYQKALNSNDHRIDYYHGALVGICVCLTFSARKRVSEMEDHIARIKIEIEKGNL